MSPKFHHQATVSRLINRLHPFVQRAAISRFGRGRLFILCVRASFVKTFEFTHLASQRRHQKDMNGFFVVPTLRGIAEDLIYLRFVSRLPQAEREKLVGWLSVLETHRRIEQQNAFFQVFRPFQPVLNGRAIDREKVEARIGKIWQRHGWPHLRSVSPPTRQIAEKLDPAVLEVVYDFIYRLTSATVHFNPPALLRSGWGMKTRVLFSAKNMAPYFSSFAVIYGAFFLCLYFEFFGRILRPTNSVKKTIAELRGALIMENRWPEMVTFEEMNIQVPKRKFLPGALIQATFAAMFTEGFIRDPHGDSPYKKWLQRSRKSAAERLPKKGGSTRVESAPDPAHRASD